MHKISLNRSLLWIFGAALICVPVYAAEQGGTSPQVERGRQLFQKPAKGMACTTCHALEGVGRSIGPDLKTLGSVVGPRGLATTIRMSNTTYVMEYALKSGETFIGIEKNKAGGSVEIWDFNSNSLRTFKDGEVSVKGNSKWKHPPAVSELDGQDLADLIGYVKAICTGVVKEVKIDDLY